MSVLQLLLQALLVHAAFSNCANSPAPEIPRNIPQYENAEVLTVQKSKPPDSPVNYPSAYASANAMSSSGAASSSSSAGYGGRPGGYVGPVNGTSWYNKPAGTSWGSHGTATSQSSSSHNSSGPWWVGVFSAGNVTNVTPTSTAAHGAGTGQPVPMGTQGSGSHWWLGGGFNGTTNNPSTGAVMGTVITGTPIAPQANNTFTATSVQTKPPVNGTSWLPQGFPNRPYSETGAGQSHTGSSVGQISVTGSSSGTSSGFSSQLSMQSAASSSSSTASGMSSTTSLQNRPSSGSTTSVGGSAHPGEVTGTAISGGSSTSGAGSSFGFNYSSGTVSSPTSSGGNAAESFLANLNNVFTGNSGANAASNAGATVMSSHSHNRKEDDNKTEN